LERGGHKSPESYLLATLCARLAKILAVLLLRHALATLLDYGTHVFFLPIEVNLGEA
jgi:hypothetical protein